MVAAVETDEQTTDDADGEDHTGAQLDALSSMVARQTVDHPPVEVARASDDSQADEAEAPSETEAPAPELVMAQSAVVVAPPAPASPAPVELDPLTAPLEQLEAGTVLAPTSTPPAVTTPDGINASEVTAERSPTDVTSPDISDDSQAEEQAATVADSDKQQSDEAAVDEDSDSPKSSSKSLPLLLALLVVLGLALVGAYTLL